VSERTSERGRNGGIQAGRERDGASEGRGGKEKRETDRKRVCVCVREQESERERKRESERERERDRGRCGVARGGAFSRKSALCARKRAQERERACTFALA